MLLLWLAICERLLDADVRCDTRNGYRSRISVSPRLLSRRPRPLAEMKGTYKILIVLIASLLPALLLDLGARPVNKVQEVRIAETAREMLESGDWIVPRYNGDYRLQKPPLPYWFTALSYRLFGVNETATRIPAVLFGLLTAFLLFGWMRRELDEPAATYASLVLVASWIGLRYFRSGEADAALSFFITATVLLGHGILGGSKRAWLRAAFGLALGLGFLCKGPAAFAMPGLTLALYAAMERRRGQTIAPLRRLFSVPGFLLLAITALGWYAWILMRMPEVAATFFAKQVDETFLSGTHPKPLWWYVGNWPMFLAPWGILIIPAALRAYRQGFANLPACVRMAWVWLGVVFILLTLTINKQMQYAVLFEPAAAIILGHYLAYRDGDYAKLNRIMFGLFCVAICVLAGVVWHRTHATLLLVYGVILALLPLGIQWLLGETRLARAILLVAGLTAAASWWGEMAMSGEPDKIAAQSLMPEAAMHSRLYQPRTSLNDGSLSFYARRVVPPITPEEIATALQTQEPLWLVGEHLPEMPGISAHVAAQNGGLTLYRLQKERPGESGAIAPKTQ